MALFLLGDVAFRRSLRLGRSGYRLLAAGLALVVVPAGRVLAVGELALLLLVLAGLRLTEATRVTPSR